MYRKILATSFLLGSLVVAHAQSVQQSGSVTPNTAAIWSGTGIIKGGVSATDSPLTTFGVTRDAADAICVSSARSNAVGRNQLCLQAATSGPAKISLQNYGTASAQDLQFILNGVTLTLPSGGGTFVTGLPPYVVGHAACFNSTSGIIQDCGVSVTSGTQFGIPYYSTTSNLISTGAATSGQLLIGQNAAAPLWTNLSGDAATLSAGGALTLNKVNGIPFNSTYTAHGVLIAEGTSAFTSLATSSVGQCLLSQGSSSDPIWSSCAAGAGSAGGSNTQVQFNNSTSLGGSVNFTWVSPALTLGVAGTTTGQLALAPAAGASGTVTVQNPSTTSAYNFNLPTGAGSSGQPLLSGGGGATAMTFGTLGVAGGGTGAASASGTALDNISGFSSTGFVQRTGAGTYAFSTVITVSGGGTGLASGTSGGIPAFTGASTMTSSALLAQYSLVAGGGSGAVPATVTKGTAGQILIDQTAANPVWSTMSGDATINSAAALTIANSAVTVGKMANAAAYTLMGNFTGSAAAPQFSTPGSLTQKASPAAGDYVVIQDNSASGQLKYATVSSISSAGSVSSIDALTGSFTTSNGVTAAGNVIGLTAARRTLPTVQTLTTTATYTTAANALWIEVFYCGGGGGGHGVSTVANTFVAGSNGVASSFNSINANPGLGATGTSITTGVPGLGGTGGTGSATRRYAGQPGGGPLFTSAGATTGASGMGGGNFLNGGTVGVALSTAVGNSAASNSGAGGSGAVNTGGTNNQMGTGGGGAECAYLIINSPAATYAWVQGTGGAGGVSVTNGGAGAAGGGYVIEHYGT